MEKFYYYEYLIKYANKEYANFLDLIKYELDTRIYHYGQHFKCPKEKEKKINDIYNIKGTIKFVLKKCIKNIFKSMSVSNTGKNILSNSYFSINSKISELGYNVIVPPWKEKRYLNEISSFSFHQQTKKIIEKLNNSDFMELLDYSFYKEIEDYMAASSEIYKKYIDALIVPYDMPTMEKIAITVFNKIKKPSFLFLHGLPERYNNLDDNRTNYLIVWGEKIKENYVHHGVSPEKIFISGHPYYSSFKKGDLRFSFDNILVITYALSGGQPRSNSYQLKDRGRAILYLYSIQSVLQKIGIKSVRFRPHPSESGLWYQRYIDTKFYFLDNESLCDSLKKTSLVIGSASTVILEAIYYGVNYILYEPVINNISLEGERLVPPFDGSDKRLPVANDEDSLLYILKNRIKIDTSIWDAYIKTPFDISFIKTLI